MRDTDALANCLTNMTDLLHRSGRLHEALAACERSLAVREPLIKKVPEITGYRACLAETHMRLGQVRYGLQQREEAGSAWRRGCAIYDSIQRLEPQHTFLMACCHAGLASLAGTPGSGLTAAEEQVEAARSIAALRLAIAAGYRNPNAYRTESGLDPLRDRSDFQVLLMDLRMPAEPFAP